MNLDDFRRLNFREIGNWPLLPKLLALAAVFVAILIGGTLLDWKDQYDTLDRAKTEEVTLNNVAVFNDKGVLTMEAVAKTFRYLDEEEVAKQRKAAKDAKDKKDKGNR